MLFDLVRSESLFEDVYVPVLGRPFQRAFHRAAHVPTRHRYYVQAQINKSRALAENVQVVRHILPGDPLIALIIHL